MSVSEQRLPPRAQEPVLDAQAMARMPAWKREILERRKAKQAADRDRARASAAGGWAQSPNAGRGSKPPLEQTEDGSSVLLESIAPVQENPFIKRERWQRQLGDREPGGGAAPTSGRSVPRLLELYSHIPGVRTIRADNIIIIESDPDYFAEASPRHGDSLRVGSLSELLPRDGEVGVAEIRADEVFVYETPLSRSEENLSTLATEEAGSGHLHGKVSRLLEKFDQNYVKPARSRSTDNLLDGLSAKDGQSKPSVMPKPLVLSKHNQGPARSDAQARSWGSSLSEAGRSPGPVVSSVSPPLSKSLPLSSPKRHPSSPSPGTTSSFSHVALKDQGTSISADRPFSVSSYRKQFEGLHSDGWQKDLLPWKSPSQRSNENGVKDCTNKGNKVIENGLPEVDFVGNHVTSVKDGKTGQQNWANASDVGNGRVPTPLKASGVEVSKGTDKWGPKCEVDSGKSPKSCPEPSRTVAEVCRTPLPKNPTPLGKVEGAAKTTPNLCNGVSASMSLNNSFEIVPATPPDVASIPEDDIQARALANLKKQSKNSFFVIPKKRADASVASRDICGSGEVSNKSDEKPKPGINASAPTVIQTDRSSSDSEENDERKGDLSDEEAPLPKADFEMKETLNKPKSKGSYDVYSTHMNAQLSSSEGTSSILPTELSEAEQKAESGVILIRKGDLPVTNIDDILATEETLKQSAFAKPSVKKDKSPSESFGGLHHPFMQRKSGNTFTVVPQRKPANGSQEAPAHKSETSHDVQPTEELAKLGALLKKRYPAAEDIQVIGGYLSLERSCLSKSGSTRKKMKISFNDSSLHTTFEYPSENSLIQEEESEASEDDEEEQLSMSSFPHPSYTSSPTSVSSPIRTNSVASALSNYTPKHTIPFDTWQEQKMNETLSSGDSLLQKNESVTEDNMLTPADSSSHSDYSSEPALYF
ncbi:taperin [Mobula birostris]|uniref:taperin n=1 Tax=Mobula birostris TaxID=1983395 RepID=UPI003B27F9E8